MTKLFAFILVPFVLILTAATAWGQTRRAGEMSGSHPWILYTMLPAH